MTNRQAVGVRAAIDAARVDAARDYAVMSAPRSPRALVGAAIAVVAIAITVTAAAPVALGSAPVVRRIVDPQHSEMRRFGDWREMTRQKHELPESCWTLNQLEDRYEDARKIPGKAMTEYRRALTGCYLASLPKA